MEYLLLDTCSLRNLFSDLSMENEDIDFIYNLVQAGRIKLITNRILQKEWEKHKLKQREQTVSSIEAKKKHAKELFSMLGNIEPDFNSINYNWLDKQIENLDSIIREKSVETEITNAVKIKSSDHQENRKAPFHKKIESLNDAYIIFSALEYFKGSDHTIIFITDNYTDFSNEKPYESKIHPEITEGYENIRLEYYHKTDLGLYKLKQKFPEFVNKKSGIKELGTSTLKLDNSISYERNLLNFIKQSYKNFNYIPPHILIDNEIIIGADENFGYFESFTVSTKNDSFLETIERLIAQYNNETSKEVLPQKDVEKILKTLIRNSIYYVSNGSLSHEIELPQTENDCKGVLCSLKKFNYLEAFIEIDQLKENTHKDIAFKAFIHFQLGNVSKSFSLNESLLNKSLNKHIVFSTLAKYNLNKLSKLFVFNLIEEKKVNYDLIKDYQQNSSFIEDETLKWLITDGFLTSAQFQLNNLKSKLISSYELVQNGGTTRNSHIHLAHNKFVEFNQFLTLNNIIFDGFLEDQQIKNDLIECMICALGIGIENSGLPKLNNYAIQVIIENAEYENLPKLLRRYNVNRIKFEKYTEIPHANLEELYKNLFSQQSELSQILGQQDDICVVENKLNKFYANALILLAYLE